MQHLVAYIDAWACLVVANKRDCVRNSADDTAVAHVEFGPNNEVGRIRHAPLTGTRTPGSLQRCQHDAPLSVIEGYCRLRTEPAASRCPPMPSARAEFPNDDPWMAAMRRGDLAGAWAISDQVLQRHRMSGEQQWRRPRH